MIEKVPSRICLLAIPKRNFLPFIFSAILLVFTNPLIAQQSKTDSLASVLNSSKTDTDKVNLISQFCNSIYLEKPLTAIEYANRGLIISENISYLKGTKKLLLLLGNAYYQMGQNDSATFYFQKLSSILDEKIDIKTVATVNENMGLLSLHRGEIDIAIDLINKANAVYESLPEYDLFAGGCSKLGTIYENSGDYDMSVNYYLKALKIYEDSQNENETGVTFMNLSSVYRCLNQFKKAKDYALKAKEKLEKAGDKTGVGVSLYKLALVYAEEKEFNISNMHLKEAEKIFQQVHNSYYFTLVKMLQGSNLDDLGDRDSAIYYYNEALTASYQTGETQLIAALNGNLGISFMEKGEHSAALKYLYKSKKLLTDINDRNQLLDLFPVFIEIFGYLNQPDSLNKYFQRYQALSDSLFSEQNTQAIAEMQTKYETEKKEKELEISAIKLEKQKSQLGLLSALVFVLLTSGVTIYILQRKKYRQNILLAKSSIDRIRAQEEEANCRIRNTISDKAAKAILEKLKHAIEEGKCYRDTELTITSLALKLNTNRDYLSQVINDTYGKNFNEFINKYRVQESVERLRKIVNGELKYTKLSVVAQESGFKSESTFYKVFKSIMNVSPGDFKKALKEM